MDFLSFIISIPHKTKQTHKEEHTYIYIYIYIHFKHSHNNFKKDSRTDTNLERSGGEGSGGRRGELKKKKRFYKV